MSLHARSLVLVIGVAAQALPLACTETPDDIPLCLQPGVDACPILDGGEDGDAGDAAKDAPHDGARDGEPRADR